MTFDFARILQSKREIRQRLAARSIEEKLAMLDALRESALAIRPMPRELRAHALRDPRLHRIVAAQPYPLLFAAINGAHLYGIRVRLKGCA